MARQKKKLRFVIRLKGAHQASGQSYAEVKRAIGNISPTTVGYYASQERISKRVPIEVIQMAEHYGVDWRDPAIVEVIELDDDEQVLLDLKVL